MSARMGLAAAGSDPAGNLGARLRQARLGAHMTVRGLARQLGVSASFVSQLENGKSQPSVATLYSLAQCLGVSIDRLFEDEEHLPSGAGAAPLQKAPQPEVIEPSTLLSQTTKEDATPVSRDKLGSLAMVWGERTSDLARPSLTTPDHRTRLVMDCGVVWEQLVRKTDQLDFMEITYPPGSSSTTDGRMLRHDDFEYGILLEGQLEVTLGFDVFTLNAGEAVGFDSSIPHLFRNAGTTSARGIWVVHHEH